MSNFEGEEREFDELDLPAEDSALPDPADETIEFEGGGEMLELGDDVLESAEIGPESEAPVEPVEPDEGGAFADMEMAAPADEFAAETAGEFAAEPEEEEPEEEVEKRPGLLQRLTETSPYVVLLGISFLAILIGIFCWFMELKSYDFQIKPAQTSMAPAVESGPPSTTATV